MASDRTGERRNPARYLIGAALIAFAGLPGCATAPKEPLLTPAQQQLNVASFDDVWTTIRDTHWDPELGGLDWEAVRDEYRPQVEAASRMSEARQAMTELIAQLKMTHFSILPADLLDDIDTGESEGQRDGGTGIDLRVLDGQAVVTSVDPASSAETLGVKPGWIVTRVDDDKTGDRLERLRQRMDDSRSITALQMTRSVTRKMAGRVGDTVEVEFLDEQGASVIHAIKLGPQRGRKVQLGLLPPFYVWFESQRLPGNIGYIAFNAFMDPLHIMGSFNEAIKEFMDADGLIIDVRGNPGGIGAMAMGMTGWLISEKKQFLGTMITRESELKFVINPRAKTFDGPVVVLVDGLTGSTAEIFPGGLKDTGRAKIVGTRSAGAALPAQMKKLPNGDGFLYAVANYISQGGEALEAKGVVPHIEARHTREALLAGRDVALEEAVGVIRGNRVAATAEMKRVN